jgi:hypothetical protein
VIGYDDVLPLLLEACPTYAASEGDHEARGLISNGFLRDLTSPEAFAVAPTGPEDFVPWLGPRALSDHNVQKIFE